MMILVIDDDPMTGKMLRFLFTEEGYEVQVEPNVTAARAFLARRQPDLLITDVMMPGTDGFGVLRGMRAKRIAPDTRVIILTCKTEERDHLRGWELGADEYLTKPFDPEELVARVKWLLQSTADALAERREAELQKAELLDRLEAAFNKSRAAASPAASALLRR